MPGYFRYTYEVRCRRCQKNLIVKTSTPDPLMVRYQANGKYVCGPCLRFARPAKRSLFPAVIAVASTLGCHAAIQHKATAQDTLNAVLAWHDEEIQKLKRMVCHDRHVQGQPCDFDTERP